MARDFDGNDDIIRWNNGWAYSPTSPLTVSWWAAIDSYASTKYIWNIEATNAPGVGVFCYTGNNKQIYVEVLGSTTSIIKYLINASTAAGSGWNHWAFVFAGNATASNSLLYLNGTPLSTTDQNGVGLYDTATGYISLGNRATDLERDYDGRLAEFGVWNRALGAGEIAQLAAGFSPLTIPKGLKFAPRLAGTELLDPISGTVGTATGTTVAAHPSNVKWKSASNIYCPNPVDASGFSPAWWTPPQLIGAF
jgi:hypothetical protein